MSRNPLDFSWGINRRWVLMLAVAILPGVAVSLVSGHLLWLVASFLAVCGVIPYTASHSNRLFTLLNSVLVCVIAYGLYLALNLGWGYFLAGVVLLSLIAGIIDNGNKEFRVLSSWIIIGCVYGAIKLGEYPLSLIDLIKIIILAALGAILVLCLPLKHPPTSARLRLILYHHPQFLFNFKYILPTVLATLVWHYFNLEAPEWIIWSALSVTYPQIDEVILKFKQRVIAGAIGVTSGVILGIIIPHSLGVTYLCFIFICLSLKMFNDYFPGYLLRSFLAVLYAASYSLHIASSRIIDVVVGGIIGVFSVYLFIFIYHKYLEKYYSE